MALPFQRTIKNYFTFLALKHTFVNDDWILHSHFDILRSEWLDWKENYLPVDVKGLTVLDVGAGEGETAFFFLKHGAKKVICIEPNPEAFKVLKVNATRHPEIQAVCSPFKPEFLSLFEFDFMKMDIEGYEEALLDVKLVKPSVIEVHGLQLRDRFIKKGYRLKGKPGYWVGCICYAYWLPSKERDSL